METRQIVVPGEVVDDSGELRPGMNTYQEGRAIYALRLGVKAVKGDRVNVISLSGRYEPQRGDMVIGTVAEVGPSNWYINIGAANDVGMHVNDVPWRVEFGETSKYLAVGDSVLLKIVHVDEMKKAQVSMKDRQCRKLTGGLILDVAPTKVPRIVGRQGSMIQMVKDATNVRIFVGQNGHVWVDGEPEDVQLALEALRKVEAEAHTTGLTDRMKAWLEERRPSASRPKRAEPEETFEEEAPREERPRRERRERPERDERPRGRDREERRDERPRPRRFEDEGEAPRRTRDERARKFRDEESEEERPRRRFADEEEAPRKPRRFEEEERPRARRFEDEAERPRPRKFEDEEPRRAPPPPRRFEEERPRPRRFQDDEEEERPRPSRRMEREDDEEDERPRRFGDGGGSGGARRRRGGRGRGRGGRKED